MKRLIKRSLYSPEAYQNCVHRLEKLTSESRPQWGSMTAAQMLSHCAEVLEVSNGKPLTNTPFAAKLFKGWIRKMVLSDKPYPKNLRTHPQYKQSSERDFETEKKRLLDALKAFINFDRESSGQMEHPLFGRMTPEERGWSMYKHLDHHLTQFGV